MELRHNKNLGYTYGHNTNHTREHNLVRLRKKFDKIHGSGTFMFITHRKENNSKPSHAK